MRRIATKSPYCLAFLMVCAGPAWAQGHRAEDSGDYFRKWMSEDAVYLISEEERAVFAELTSEDEKIQFVEAFWRRRDPDPRTAINEFKEEHYRRIAYANERYSAGLPGWKTDRGRIYIKFGPPAQVDLYPMGTTLQDIRGGIARAIDGAAPGGIAQSRQVRTFPFEVWRYRYIEGIGNDVHIEFVDRTGSGLYNIAIDDEEKNVFAYRDPAADVQSTNRSDFFKRERDRQFFRTEMLKALHSAPAVEFTDLQQVVSSRVSYDQIPFEATHSILQVTETSYYVPITLAVEARHLKFEALGGSHQAKVNVFVQASNVQKRVEAVVEDTLDLKGPSRDLERMRQGKAVYAKKLLLASGRHVIDIVLKDDHSGKIGTGQMLVVIPPSRGELAVSSLILADVMRPLTTEESLADPFAFGTHKVVPNVGARFANDQQAGLFFQIYRLTLDQASMSPEVLMEAAFKQGERTLLKIEDDLSAFGVVRGESASVTISVPLKSFPLGEVRVEVQVRDKLSGKSARAEAGFQVVSAQGGS